MLTVLLAALAMAVPAAAAPEVTHLTAVFDGNGFAVERLAVLEVGGIVVIRGRTYDRSAAEAVGLYAQALGYSRVANLIQVLDAPNDAQIRREAEREIVVHRSLEGSRLSVESENGMVIVKGSVRNDVQKEEAIRVIRSVSGVRGVRAEIERQPLVRN